MPAPKDPIKKEEWKRKIREYNLRTGKIPPSRRGTITSEKVRGKISISMKNGGYTPPNLLGRKRTQDFKNRVSKNHKRPWLGKKGIESANYIDGRTSKSNQIRQSLEYRLWRSSIFQLDNFTCQKCEVYGTVLEAHHINNFSEFFDLRLSINNGITLCKKCHRSFHTDYGRKNNTREQLQEFLTTK